MSLVAVNPILLYGPVRGFTSTTAGNVMLLDAANEKGAWVGQAPATGTIDRIGFRAVTVTTGATLDVRLETVGADGNPTGTLWGTNTNASQVVPTASNVWFETTLTAGAAVTRGDLIAIVIANPAVSFGNLEIGRYGAYTIFPLTTHYTGTWAKDTKVMLGFIRYSNGTYPYTEGLLPGIVTTPAYNTGTNPNERGAKITVPFTCKVSGLWMNNVSVANIGDFDAILYSDTNTVLGSVSVDGDTTAVSNSFNMPFSCLFNTEITLTAGQVVRAIRKPTSVTNTVIGIMTLYSAAAASAMPGGTGSIYTTRNNGGAWTDTSTISPAIGLIVTALDDGQSVSGGGEKAYSFIG